MPPLRDRRAGRSAVPPSRILSRRRDGAGCAIVDGDVIGTGDAGGTAPYPASPHPTRYQDGRRAGDAPRAARMPRRTAARSSGMRPASMASVPASG